MAQYHAEAILVAARDWGEADKMVTLFSREYGKIIAFANGARRPKSPLAGGMQLFTHLDVRLASGKNYDSVKQCEIKHSFRHVQEDFNCMAYGTFIAELVAELCPERHPEPQVFDLLLEVMMILALRNPRMVALAWAWQLLFIMGYYPDFEHCVICGRTLSLPAYFSFSDGGCICSICDHYQLPEVSEKMVSFINCLLHIDWRNPVEFTVNGTVLMQTEKILMEYLMQCLDKPLKSMNFIKQVAAVMQNDHK
jgi:DNA repair protein RecO (recombination protein O)